MTNDEKFESGLAALVDLYHHACKLFGGADKVFATPEKGEAAYYFVTEFQKRQLDLGPQPTRPAAPVTNFYDEPRPPALEDSAKAAAAPVGDAPPVRRDPSADLLAANTPPSPPSPSPSDHAIAALMNED